MRRPRVHAVYGATIYASAIFFGLSSVVTHAAAPTAKSPGRLLVGAAKVDITPSIDAIAPAAQKSDILPVMSIRDHLHVRAIYFENGIACGALVGVEQGAMRGN